MDKPTNSLLISKGIMKNYGDLQVLKGIDLDIVHNEIVCLLGPSGSGKSTLMNILSGLLNLSEGEIFFDGIPIDSKKNVDYYRAKCVSMIFQNFALIDHLTVVENLILANWYNQPDFEPNVKKAKDILEKMGLINQMSKYPSQLSAGQKQRIGIARALLKNPRIIFADEPTGALDTKNSELIMKMLISAIRNNNDGSDDTIKARCLIYSTHDLEIAQFADRILMLKSGKLFPVSPDDLDDVNSILELY